MKTQQERFVILTEIIEMAAPSMIPHGVVRSGGSSELGPYVSAIIYRKDDESHLAVAKLYENGRFKVVSPRDVSGLKFEHCEQAQVALKAAFHKICKPKMVATVLDPETGNFVVVDPAGKLEWHQLTEDGLYWKVMKSDPRIYSIVEYDAGTIGCIGSEVWEDLVLNNFQDDYYFLRVVVPDFEAML